MVNATEMSSYGRTTVQDGTLYQASFLDFLDEQNSIQTTGLNKSSQTRRINIFIVFQILPTRFLWSAENCIWPSLGGSVNKTFHLKTGHSIMVRSFTMTA